MLGVVLMLVLALAASFCHSNTVWQIDREFARRDAARRVTLAQAQTLGGVLMPAGARLTLAKEGELETFTEALFDPPALWPACLPHRTLPALRFQDVRGAAPLSAHHPPVGRGAAAGRELVCDTSQKLRLRVEGEGTQNSPNACWPRAMPSKGRGALAGRNRVAAYGEASSTDGHREPVNWMVRVRDPLGLPLAGLTLGRPTVQLDENRQLLAVSDAELACPLTLGEMRYPAGARR